MHNLSQALASSDGQFRWPVHLYIISTLKGREIITHTSFTLTLLVCLSNNE